MTTVNTREEQAPIEHENRRSASRRLTPAGWGDSARRAPCRKPTFSAAGRGWRRRPLLCLALAVAAVCLSAMLVPAGAAADWTTDLTLGPGYFVDPSLTAYGSTPYLAWTSANPGVDRQAAWKPGVLDAAWQFFPLYQAYQPTIANIVAFPILAGLTSTPNGEGLVAVEAEGGAFGQSGTLTTSATPAYPPALAGDGFLNVLVAWVQHISSGNAGLFVSMIPLTPTASGILSWSSPGGLLTHVSQDVTGPPSATTDTTDETGQGPVAYLAWPFSANSQTQIQVARCAGASLFDPCVDVGGPLGNGDVYQESITTINGVPYIAWTEDYMGNTEVSTARWNGSSWQPLGGGGFYFARGYEPGVAITGVDGQPWIALSDPDHTYVYQLSPEPGYVGGGAWEQVGSPLEPAGSGSLSMTTTTDGVPWLAIGTTPNGYSDIFVQYMARLQPLDANLTATQLRSGARLGFTLPAARTIHLAFTQLVAGRQVGGRCVAKTSRNRTKPRCMRTVTRGTLVTHGHKGSNSLVVRPHLSNKTLSPGRYELKLTTVTSGGVSSIPNWVTVKL